MPTRDMLLLLVTGTFPGRIAITVHTYKVKLSNASVCMPRTYYTLLLLYAPSNYTSVSFITVLLGSV